jgi:histidine triad (HIT) family protein
MATIFSRIVAGELPCYQIAETNDFLAFLDIRPLAVGHTLVVPKNEVDYLFDMDDHHLGNMMIFAKQVALAIQQCVPCRRIGVAVIGLEVPHAHIHLMPIHHVGDLSFGRPPLQLSAEDLEKLAGRIRDVYSGSNPC